MSDGPYERIDAFDIHPNVSIRVSGGAKVLEARTGGLTIVLTVPEDVLEWFVDVKDGDAVVVQDWWDYEGYDRTPKQDLVRSMASDIDTFMERLLSRDLRLAPAARTGLGKTVWRWTKKDIRRAEQRHVGKPATRGKWRSRSSDAGQDWPRGMTATRRRFEAC